MYLCGHMIELVMETCSVRVQFILIFFMGGGEFEFGTLITLWHRKFITNLYL